MGFAALTSCLVALFGCNFAGDGRTEASETDEVRQSQPPSVEAEPGAASPSPTGLEMADGPVGRLKANCMGFTSASAGVVAGGVSPLGPLQGFLRASAAGYVVLDSGDGSRPRYSWDGQEVWSWTLRSETKKRHTEAEGIVRDLWSECRSGFPRVRWSSEHPRELGYPDRSTVRAWIGASIDYSWASNTPIFVQLDPESGAPLVVLWKSGDRWSQVAFPHFTWDASVSASVFRREPPDPPPREALQIRRADPREEEWVIK